MLGQYWKKAVNYVRGVWHLQADVRRLTQVLRVSALSLGQALAPYQPKGVSMSKAFQLAMVNPILQELATEVAKNVEVEAGAVVLINGFAARMDAAVEAAVANGATAEQLASIRNEISVMKVSRDALAAAIAANTPQGPPAPPVDPNTPPVQNMTAAPDKVPGGGL